MVFFLVCQKGHILRRESIRKICNLLIPKKYVFQGTDYKEKPYKVDWKAFGAFHLESKMFVF